MQLHINKRDLVDAVNIVSKAVSTKTTMPILACILIDAATERICLIGNNTELGIKTYVEGEIIEHGVIAIDASIFGNIVRKLSDDIITISTQGEQVTIKCGKAHFNIMGHDGDTYEYPPEIDQQYGIEVSEYTLREIINQTIFSLATNESNQMMVGELFEIRNNTLRVVALDGHRIAIRKVELKGSYDDNKAIIPGKTLSEISKIIGGSTEESVHIYLTRNHALFTFGETTVVSRLIEGEYFNIDQMLSTDYHTQIRVNRSELISCLERAVLLVKEEDKKPIILIIRDGEVELRIRTEIGSLDESIMVDKEGEDVNIGFNPKFVIDALRAIDEDEVTFYLNGSRAPAFIRDENTYCYLVLPVNFVTID